MKNYRTLLLLGVAVVLLVTWTGSVAAPMPEEENIALSCTDPSEEASASSEKTCGSKEAPGLSSSSPESVTTESSYTYQDDVSWAITDQKLKYPYHQKLYDDFMAGCRKASPYCKSQEALRLYMNKYQPMSVFNYTTTGFTKIKTPPLLWKILTEFYQRNKGQEVIEWGSKINPYHNNWEIPTEIIRLDNGTLGGGPSLHGLIARAVRPLLEEWVGQRLASVSVYGIRVYKSNSILTPHCDRMPLVTSCIINIDQDVDDDWPLEVFGHDGVAHNVTMQPGDMV